MSRLWFGLDVLIGVVCCAFGIGLGILIMFWIRWVDRSGMVRLGVGLGALIGVPLSLF